MHKRFRLYFFCAVAALLAPASIAFAQGRGGEPNPLPALPKLEKIKDNLYLITNSDVTPEALRYWGGNITVLLTKDGVILIDAKYARAHDDVVAKVKSLTDKPIKYVILTHNHGDHSEGAPQLEAMGATVIISDDDRENMARAANPAWLPSVTYIGQSRLFLGGNELQLRQFRGHTRGDTAVYFPALRVIVLGDLLTTNDLQPPIVNYGDGGNWTRLDHVHERGPQDGFRRRDSGPRTPGHQEPRCAAIRDKFVAIQQRVRTLNREKKTQEEISATLMSEFPLGAGEQYSRNDPGTAIRSP